MMVLVLGVPRSGTSMMAGVIDRLGVRFYSSDTKPDRHAAGYYHDAEWTTLNPSHRFSDFRRLLETRSAEGTWGVKCHGLYNLHQTAPMIAKHEPRVICMQRANVAIARSHKVKWEDLQRSKQRMKHVQRIIDRNLRRFQRHKIPILGVNYDSLIDQPPSQIIRMVRFLKLNLQPEKFAEAIAFVQPNLRHHTKEARDCSSAWSAAKRNVDDGGYRGPTRDYLLRKESN